MKAVTAATTALAGLTTAVAGTGWYAIAGLDVLALALMAIACWVIANTARTGNAVALITATRGRAVPRSASDRPDPPAGSASHEPPAAHQSGAMSYPARSVTSQTASPKEAHRR